VGEGGLEPPHPFGHRNLNPGVRSSPCTDQCSIRPLSWTFASACCRTVSVCHSPWRPVALQFGLQSPNTAGSIGDHFSNARLQSGFGNCPQQGICERVLVGARCGQGNVGGPGGIIDMEQGGDPVGRTDRWCRPRSGARSRQHGHILGRDGGRGAWGLPLIDHRTPAGSPSPAWVRSRRAPCCPGSGHSRSRGDAGDEHQRRVAEVQLIRFASCMKLVSHSSTRAPTASGRVNVSMRS